jgi:hypothetical protein
MFTAPFLLFAVAQGGVVFITAWLLSSFVKSQSCLSKLGLMLASYCIWAAITLGGFYTMMGGGSGGLFEGMGFPMILCITALLSSLVYAVIWSLRSSVRTNCND